MCGKTVLNAELLPYEAPCVITPMNRAFWHDVYATDPMVCRKCLAVEWAHRYIYAVREKP